MAEDRFKYIRRQNKIKTNEELLNYLIGQLKERFEHWDDVYANGCSDPFWADGTNLNLIRNHINYYKREIEECCAEYSLPVPEIIDKPTPDELPNNYMANGRENPQDRWMSSVEKKAGTSKKPEDSIKTIENLSQLKKALKTVGTKFKFVDHWRKDCIGQVRVVKSCQTNGVFNAVDGQPNHEWSTCNDGRGIMLYFGKASQWIFKDGSCTWHDDEYSELYYSLVVLSN